MRPSLQRRVEALPTMTMENMSIGWESISPSVVTMLSSPSRQALRTIPTGTSVPRAAIRMAAASSIWVTRPLLRGL